MVFEHDYKNFPELTNKQITEFGFSSPHKQIEEDFTAMVVKVHDGDTVTLRTPMRDFDFPLRLLDIDAPEMNAGGEVARDWLREQILNENVEIKIDKKNRVGKYGRLLGYIKHMGLDMGETMRQKNLVKKFDQRTEGQIPNINKTLMLRQWL